MYIRAYLRASTSEQNANRAKDTLKQFVKDNGHRIAGFYIENISGNLLNRPELLRLLDESEPGDVLLVESVDRLTRLSPDNWALLVKAINDKGIHVVSMDLPTSHMTFNKNTASNDFMDSILKAINNMLLEILAASAYKEYKERERKQREAIDKLKDQNFYKGRKADESLHERIRKLTEAGFSINSTTDTIGCSRSTVVRVRRKYKAMTS